jgi:DNA-binding transcriptional MerR regulator/methylmalonyl-CoA mutase cobalamin-binding subunit
MYTISEAASRAGVSVPVLRAWERRYGVVTPTRTPAGYRLYDDTAIERIRAMRRLIAEGWSASQAAHHLETESVLPIISRVPTATLEGSATPERHQFADRFVAAAAGLDAEAIESLLDELLAAGSFEHVVDDRLMPALHALGDAWESGDVSVAAEHAASHAVLRRLSAAYGAAGRGVRSEGPVLVGLPPGSRHELAALAFATALRRLGIGSVYLGADVPQADWIDAARKARARAIVIGVPTSSDVAPAEAIAAAATELHDLVVAVGGPGAAEASLPPSVIRLPDGIASSAAALEDALNDGTARDR